MRDNLLKTMIGQHVVLKNDLGVILDMFEKKGKYDAKIILSQLKIFKRDLKTHLQLENKVFYVQLIEKMEKKKMNTERTKNFIGQMDEIENEIKSFIKQYSDIAKIENAKAQFKKDINNMVSRLLLRVELEEDSVYMYWEFLLS